LNYLSGNGKKATIEKGANLNLRDDIHQDSTITILSTSRAFHWKIGSQRL
jgi:hypothetical protein